MTALTGLIARHKQLFSEHPFLDYVRDNRIPVQSRLAFLPAMSHFVMSFSDLNKYALPFPILQMRWNRRSTPMLRKIHTIGRGFCTICKPCR
ncbi:hypothetical protein [Serratia marcescens]|uniref:hypothetical protein n=1 Tax=Serratia marcescens TaxID=615 RepID=UPI003EDEBAD2